MPVVCITATRRCCPLAPHKGELVDEPEYEGWSGAGWAIGCTDPVAVSWLNTQIDRACVDVNEFGWLIGWVMECQEKGYITREQLGGLEVKWGDAEAANQLLQMIIRREGFGDVLAEGVKRASEHVGGPAAECAIYTMKGDTPRGHDHRARWEKCSIPVPAVVARWTAVRPCDIPNGVCRRGTIPLIRRRWPEWWA